MISRPLARAGIAGLALTLAGGGLLLAAAAPAQAGILDTPQLQTSVTFGNSGPAACTPSGPGNVTSPVTPFAANGIPVNSSSASSRTFTNNGNAADVTTMNGSVSSTITATAGADALSSFTSTTHFANSAVAALGTAQQCGGAVNSAGITQFKFDLPSPRVISLDVDSPAGATFQVTLLRTTAPTYAYQLTSIGAHSADHGFTVLGAGTYQAIIQSFGTLNAPTNAEPTNANAGDIVVTGKFATPGTAEGLATGDGGKYLTLADSRNCAAGSLTGTWKNKAGKGKNRKVKKAVFRVNGAKVATVRKPKKNQVTTLSGLASGKPLDVEVTIKLAKKGAGSVTVERSYLTCT